VEQRLFDIKLAVDALSEQLFSATQGVDARSLHVVVDRVLADPLSDECQRASRTEIPIKHDEIKKQHQPYLLQLGHVGRDETVRKTLELGLKQALRGVEERPYGRTICGWIAFDVPVDRVARHLGKSALLRTNKGVRVFRFWDPRVFDLLSPSLSADQIKALLGPVSSWCWLGRDGSLRTMVRGYQSSSRSMDQTQLSLGADQITSLSIAEYVNRTLDVLQDMGKDVSDTRLPARLAQSMMYGSIQWKLGTDFEYVTYALYCVLVGQDFDKAPKVFEVMRRANVTGASPIEALNSFDESYWDLLKSHINQDVTGKPFKEDERYG
jgi:Domain of unknown function (DUF4123)